MYFETPGDNALHEAARVGFDQLVAQVLAADPTLINARNDHKETPLDVAVGKGYGRIVAQMLATNVACVGSITVGLERASRNGYDKVVEMLLSARPSLISATDPHTNWLLSAAIEHGHTNRFTQLLAACPDLIDARWNSDRTVLHHAVRYKRDEMVTQILALRPEMVSAVDMHGWNVLSCAVHAQSPSIGERLLALDPRLVFQISKYGTTILHEAAKYYGDEQQQQFVAKLFRMNPQALTPKIFAQVVEAKQEKLVELFFVA